MVGGDQPGRFPQSALGPVPFDGAADAACRGEADPDERNAVLSISTLCDDRAFRRHDPLCDREKVRPLLQAFDGWRVAET